MAHAILPRILFEYDGFFWRKKYRRDGLLFNSSILYIRNPFRMVKSKETGTYYQGTKRSKMGGITAWVALELNVKLDCVCVRSRDPVPPWKWLKNGPTIQKFADTLGSAIFLFIGQFRPRPIGQGLTLNSSDWIQLNLWIGRVKLCTMSDSHFNLTNPVTSLLSLTAGKQIYIYTYIET